MHRLQRLKHDAQSARRKEHNKKRRALSAKYKAQGEKCKSQNTMRKALGAYKLGKGRLWFGYGTPMVRL
jgi:hypothetical protein